jgi:4-amino-4-deoxy-L-arabinose transferase-like glycosyltransferase
VSVAAAVRPAPPASAGRGARVRAGWLAELAWLDRRHRLVYLLLIAAAVGITAANIGRAPDIDIDEVLYTFAAQRVAGAGSISWNGLPILVHPSLFFLVLGGWLAALGDVHEPLLAAIRAARGLNVLFCTGEVVLTASLAKAWTAKTGPARVQVMLGAGLLVAFDPFLARFGRAVLLEPMTLFLALAAVRVWWGLRGRTPWIAVPTTGVLIGLSVLTKEPAIFVAAAPLLAAVLRRRRAEIVRAVGAVAVGAFVFASFVVANLVQGQGRALFDVQTFDIRRLLGLAQASGLNRADVSPTAAFTGTFVQYAAGYFVLIVGGVALIVVALRGRRRVLGPDADARATAVVALGLLSYAFLAYSTLVGQSDEQLTVYAVPGAALLATLGGELAGRSQRVKARRSVGGPGRGALVVLALVGGLGSWVAYLAPADTAISQTEAYIRTYLPPCTPVNSTGDPFTWAATLTSNPIGDYTTGPAALAHGVHVFLLSPKDAEFYYAPSSPQLEAWIEAHGREVFSVPSHTYDSIGVWIVGDPTPESGFSQGCTVPLPPPARHASAGIFAGLLAGSVTVVAAGAVLGERRTRAAARRPV